MGKDLFSSNGDIRKNAYLNWNTDPNDMLHNLYVLAGDYADGATALINMILQDNTDKKADALIMPILYSIDQAIELYLKAILQLVEIRLGNSVSCIKTHDINNLLGQVKSKIRSLETNTRGLEKHLEPVGLYIAELYAKIRIVDNSGKTVANNIDFARYPFDTDLNPHFYIVDSGSVVIDVEKLGNRFTSIRNSLESLFGLYEEKNT